MLNADKQLLDARLRKIMTPETLARFYRYDVQLAEKEWPDIEATFFPERRAVRRSGILLVWASVPDVRAHHDQ